MRLSAGPKAPARASQQKCGVWCSKATTRGFPRIDNHDGDGVALDVRKASPGSRVGRAADLLLAASRGRDAKLCAFGGRGGWKWSFPQSVCERRCASRAEALRSGPWQACWPRLLSEFSRDPLPRATLPFARFEVGAGRGSELWIRAPGGTFPCAPARC